MENRRFFKKMCALFGLQKTESGAVCICSKGHFALVLVCIFVLLAGACYIAHWYLNLARVERSNEFYRGMYVAAESPSPGAVMPTVPALEPIPTPGADTLVMPLPTVPPLQESFAELLMFNPETVGFLTVSDLVALPVVQRINDNDYYLTHNFAGEESEEGAIFLDGMNRLELGDMCLIVYGHNMRNDTMFGRLDEYKSLEYLQKNCIFHFDTIYQDATYVPFAVFSASMDETSASYVNLRQFSFTQERYDSFVADLKSHSLFDIPVNVAYGDRLLLLVTCNYTQSDGRFVIALRQMHPDEEEADIREMLISAEKQ